MTVGISCALQDCTFQKGSSWRPWLWKVAYGSTWIKYKNLKIDCRHNTGAKSLQYIKTTLVSKKKLPIACDWLQNHLFPIISSICSQTRKKITPLITRCYSNSSFSTVILQGHRCRWDTRHSQWNSTVSLWPKLLGAHKQIVGDRKTTDKLFSFCHFFGLFCDDRLCANAIAFAIKRRWGSDQLNYGTFCHI